MGKQQSIRLYWLVYAIRPDGPKFYGLYYDQPTANAAAASIVGAQVQRVPVVGHPEAAIDVSALIA